MEYTEIYNLSPKNSFVFPQKICTITLNGGIVSGIEEALKKNEIASKVYVEENNESPEIVFDFGKKVSGFVFVDLISSSEDLLQYCYGPTIESLYWKGEICLTGNKGLCICEQMAALRYLKVKLVSKSVIPADCWVEFKGIGIKFSAYPVIYRGGFNSDNEELNRIWNAGAYTVQMCMQKSKCAIPYSFQLPELNSSFIKNWKSIHSDYVIYDGPRRDREVWIGDARTVALSIYYAFGACEVVKSTIDLSCQLQTDAGLIPGSCSSRQEFIEFNFWFVILLWEYYLHTGDYDFLSKTYPFYKNVMDWIVYSVDDNGLIDVKKTWMWTLNINNKPVEAQCVLYKALECAIEIEKALGATLNNEIYHDISNRIKKEINQRYWSEEKGVFFDRFQNDYTKVIIPADANVFAVIFGIADETQSRRILKYLKDNMWTDYGSTTLDKRIEDMDIMWPHNKQIWPFINAYEVEANFIVGNTEEAFELIHRCWGNMLSKGSGTFWELVDSNTGCYSLKPFAPEYKLDSINSYCHGWSGWISYIIQAYVLGVKPVDIAFEEIHIKPNLGDLKKVSGVIPVPEGRIEVSYIVKEKDIEIIIKNTANKKIKFELCSKMTHNKNIYINGVAAFIDGNRTNLSVESNIAY